MLMIMKKMGFYDECGDIIIEAKYDFVEAFVNDISIVSKGCKKKLYWRALHYDWW